ncbi:MAG: META domain-containing protein [Candidatus Paceibacterota bacterium]|jgi:heat shock protein HslJ
MNKKILWVGVVIVVLAVGTFGAYVAFCPTQKIWKHSATIVPVSYSDEKNTTYQINGASSTLKGGVAEMEAAPGSAEKIITRYFGNEVRHDFNSDGREDVAFVLTQQTGGSGTFYYVVMALNTPAGYIGSDAVLLGDRIAPQTTEMGKGNIIVVNYADRKPGEPFTTQPSVGKSIWLLLDPQTMKLGEVAQNFEGEADPARMSLEMKKWNWVNTTYVNGTEIKARDLARFSIIFKDNKTFSATTDCNGIGGEYVVNGSKISFTKMMSTLMYCEGSQEQDYTKMLGEVTSFHFTSKGELVFNLNTDKGEMVFR